MKSKIFSYGSNLLLERLCDRVQSARFLSRGYLTQHALRWHKPGRDGSGKCDAFFTGNATDIVWGGVFEIEQSQKILLDKAEGLGVGYNEKMADIIIEDSYEAKMSCTLYTAIPTKPDLRPFDWYKAFVVSGALQCGLPIEYIDRLRSVPASPDHDRERDRINRILLPAWYAD